MFIMPGDFWHQEFSVFSSTWLRSGNTIFTINPLKDYPSSFLDLSRIFSFFISSNFRGIDFYLVLLSCLIKTGSSVALAIVKILTVDFPFKQAYG